ncbi:uncharacterized protein LOC141591352 [Silene latifolia]|uniref:uncharacterized protein LOC141591352 n=1 Tax=Silene latifolia TaxID=37657 RepID=UPI003D7755C3
MGLSSKQVSSDGNGWNQALLENPRTLEFPKTSPIIMNKNQQQQQQDQPEQLNCPRCDSTNTKFCYYNNYNKSQPRHFCKACKRHWTKGGTLRNVPVGGGRKNKRLKITKPASKPTTTTTTNNNNNNNNNNMGGTLHSQHLRASLPLGGSFATNNNNIMEDKSFSEAFYHTFLKQQDRSLPESSINFTSKGLNDGIYLDSTTMKTTSLGLSTQHHDHQDNIQLFNYTNLLGSFDSNNNNTCSISTTNTSIQSPSVYNFTSDNDHGNNDGLLENDHHPWTMHTSSTRNNNINVNSNINVNNNVVDMMSSWGWEDLDKFVTVEADLTMPWDNEDIKP